MHCDLFRVILFGKSTFDESYTYNHVDVYIGLIFYCRLNQNDVFMVFFSVFTTWNQR